MNVNKTLINLLNDLGIDPATLPQLTDEWTWEFINETNVDDTKWEYMNYCEWCRELTDNEITKWGISSIAVRSDVLNWCRINQAIAKV